MKLIAILLFVGVVVWIAAMDIDMELKLRKWKREQKQIREWSKRLVPVFDKSGVCIGYKYTYTYRGRD